MATKSNFEIALAAEMKKVVRCFQHYTADHVALLYSRVGNPCRKALDRGEFFYCHPDVPGLAFRTRSEAARYALTHEVEAA